MRRNKRKKPGSGANGEDHAADPESLSLADEIKAAKRTHRQRTGNGAGEPPHDCQIPPYDMAEGVVHVEHRSPKADNLIIYPAFLVIMAAKEFFVDHYNHGRDRKNLDNLTPSDVDFGRGKTISPERQHRRLQHRVQAV
jgi:hypothetical protein